SGAQFGVFFDLAANGVAVLVRHDHVGDDHIRAFLLELRESRSSVGAGNHVDVFASERNLDDFAHGGAVVDKIYRGNALGGRFLERGNDHGFTHCASLSAISREPSSTSRMASSMRSVAERSTVRCVDVVP